VWWNWQTRRTQNVAGAKTAKWPLATVPAKPIDIKA
jgi:hypothetical protein